MVGDLSNRHATYPHTPSHTYAPLCSLVCFVCLSEFDIAIRLKLETDKRETVFWFHLSIYLQQKEHKRSPCQRLKWHRAMRRMLMTTNGFLRNIVARFSKIKEHHKPIEFNTPFVVGISNETAHDVAYTFCLRSPSNAASTFQLTKR